MAEIRQINIKPGETIQITCEDVQPTPQPEPTPDGDKGKHLYSMGAVSDAHFDVDDEHNSEYEQDLKNALRYYERESVDAVNSAGDLCQYNDGDLDAFRKAYGASTRLPFFTAMGNHDYLRIYHKRKDKTQADCEKLWRQIVELQGGDVHYFGSTFKDNQNFWYEKNGDIWLFLSIDYGKSTGSPWDDVARGFNLLDYTDKYVSQMMQYVADTKYDGSREKNFDYQFYNPAALIWAKRLIDVNPKKRIFLNAHHFIPNGAGDTFGYYSRLRIWPYPTSDAIRNKYYSGSNTLCGLTFWFFDKLLQQHQNIIMSDGHSHYETTAQEDVITRHYDVKQPTGKEVTPLVDDLNTLIGTQYDYQLYTPVGHSTGDTAPTIHLPSLSKPTTRDGKSLYGASEGCIIEVYEKAVTVKWIRFKSEGSSSYENKVVKTVDFNLPNDQSAVVIPEEPETDDHITLIIKNTTEETVCFSGKLNLYISQSLDCVYQDTMPACMAAPDSTDGGNPHWWKNPFTLKPGEEKVVTLPEIYKDYVGNGKEVKAVDVHLSDYVGCYFVPKDKVTDKGVVQIPAVKLGCAVYDAKKKETSNSAFIAYVAPIGEKIEMGKTYRLDITSVSTNYKLMAGDKDNRYIHV